MKKVYLLLSLSLVLAAAAVNAQNTQTTYSLQSFYPTPIGMYGQIRLVPHSALGTPCKEGTIYYKEGDAAISLCVASGATTEWIHLFGLWIQKTDPPYNIYVPYDDDPTTKTPPAANLKLHIGGALTTADIANLPKLTLDDFYDTRTTQDGGIIAMGNSQNNQLPSGGISGPASLFLWYPRKSALWAGNLGTGTLLIEDTKPRDLTNTTNIGQYSVAFGSTCFASGKASAVSGGEINTAHGNYSTVGGGINNSAMAQYSAIAGGKGNCTGFESPYNSIIPCSPDDNKFQFIGGGEANIAGGLHSVILGGRSNKTPVEGSAIGGGEGNINKSIYGTILGGSSNTLQNIHTSFIGDHNTIAGGDTNSVTYGQNNFIGGGRNNQISGDFNAVGGGGGDNSGVGNIATGNTASIIIGGTDNKIESDLGFIGGGQTNRIAPGGSTFAVISGGKNNCVGIRGTNENCICNGTMSGVDCIPANRRHQFIGGGINNTASGDHATVMGGQNNTASGHGSFVGGGEGNIAMGNSSVVAGGQYNTAAGDYSWAGGQYVTVNGNNSFAWGVGTEPSPIVVEQDNSFVLFPNNEGFVGIRKLNPSAALEVGGYVRISQKNGNYSSLKIENASWELPSSCTPFGLKWSPVDGYIRDPNDLAEIFHSDKNLSAGDVLILDPEQSGKVRLSRQSYDASVIGIVSAYPAVTFEGDQLVMPSPSFSKGKNPPVALAGRVLVKVSLENGPIAPGDLLTSASKPGHAMKAADRVKANHAIIGKALEPFTGGPKGAKTGLIETVIMIR